MVASFLKIYSVFVKKGQFLKLGKEDPKGTLTPHGGFTWASSACSFS